MYNKYNFFFFFTARKLLDKVGKFYTTKDLAEKHTNFTFLLATLLLHNR